MEQRMVIILNSNSFFKPTPLYNEFMILDLIEKDSNITQREISKAINVAVSMVNNYLNEYEEEGLIIRKKYSSKTVKGKERRKKLNIDYLNASQKLYNSAKENIEEFLAQIESRGFKKILLCGAGEVAEILLQTIVTNKNSQVDVLAVIDDDINKQGKVLGKKNIIPLLMVNEYKCDGILVSSYKHKDVINKNLMNIKFPQNNIINFFMN